VAVEHAQAKIVMHQVLQNLKSPLCPKFRNSKGLKSMLSKLHHQWYKPECYLSNDSKKVAFNAVANIMHVNSSRYRGDANELA